MPDKSKVLLDRCIVKSNHKPQDLDYYVTYDFFLLEPTGKFGFFLFSVFPLYSSLYQTPQEEHKKY